MKQGLANEVMYLKGVGPQRAALLAARETRTIQALLGYLPFRYENRLRFASIRELAPGGTYTVQAEVVSGGLVSFARSRNAVYHLMVRDATGVLHCKFFHSGYLEGRFKARKRIVLHGKVDIDPYRPGRLEMINPQYELIGDESADSTEVGRIVPIYEAIGSLGSRTLRRVIYSTLANLDAAIPDPQPSQQLARYGFPSRRDALTYVHFPPPTEDVETLNAFRSPAHRSEEHTSELQSLAYLVCRLLLEKKKNKYSVNYGDCSKAVQYLRHSRARALLRENKGIVDALSCLPLSLPPWTHALQ